MPVWLLIVAVVLLLVATLADNILHRKSADKADDRVEDKEDD